MNAKTTVRFRIVCCTSSSPARSSTIFSQEDWMPTLLAAAGDPDVKEKPLKGAKFGDKTFKAHLDGYNQMDLLAGKGQRSFGDTWRA